MAGHTPALTPAIPKPHWPVSWIAVSGGRTIISAEVWKPYIGQNDRPLTTQDMEQAVRINRRAEVCMVLLIVLIQVVGIMI